MPKDISAEEKVRKLARDKGRYNERAYIFLFEALEYTMLYVTKEQRHVSAKELLGGIKEYAILAFGPFVQMVFKMWRVTKTDDFGVMIKHLVEAKLMGHEEHDRFEDFDNGFDFDHEFSLEKTVKLKKEDSKDALY